MLTTSFETVRGDRRLRVARLGDVAGSREPPLVLLHGYPDNLQVFCELAPRLAEARPVLAFDWPGMGESDAWSGGATPYHQAERLVELLDHFGIERAVPVGLDMGGQPALDLAARHPERVAALVVMNSLVQHDAPTSWEIDVLRRFGWNRLVIRRLPGVVFRRAERTFLPSGERLPAELRDDLWRCFRRPEVRAFVVRMCAGYQGYLPRLAGLYPAITAPTLVLWGERDKHFPTTQAEHLHRAVAGSKLVVVEGGEHWMCWSRPDEVAAAIGTVLRSRG